MTREEAIQELKEINTALESWSGFTKYPHALYIAIDMAIEALQTEPMKCKDCIQKHIGGSVTHYYWCDRWDMEVDETDYCSWGERREP